MRGKRWNLLIDEINMTERSRAWIREKGSGYCQDGPANGKPINLPSLQT